MENWYLPITIVPGIGLLILSTSNLVVALSKELDGLVTVHPESKSIIARKLVQLKTLNTTMVLFYVAVACLAGSGLIGSLDTTLLQSLAVYMSILGIAIMLLAIILLIIYSYKALRIRQDQFKNSLLK